jgi:hypothetical protein
MRKAQLLGLKRRLKILRTEVDNIIDIVDEAMNAKESEQNSYPEKFEDQFSAPRGYTADPVVEVMPPPPESINWSTDTAPRGWSPGIVIGGVTEEDDED